MDNYEVTDPRGATIGVGNIVRLNPEQAAARATSLEPAGRGCYTVAAAIQFKAGEVIGLEGPPPAALAAKLAPPKKKAPAANDDAKDPGAGKKASGKKAPAKDVTDDADDDLPPVA